MIARFPFVVVVVAIFAVGCSSSRASYDDLPTQPIALALHSEDDAKQFEGTLKQEAERRAEKRQKPPIADPAVRMEYRVEDLVELTRNRARFSRLLFYDAVEREGERVDFAARGARPIEWSADRSKLLFAAEKGRRSQLFEWIEASGEVRQLTFGRPHFDGSFGPNGELVAVRLSPLEQRGDAFAGGLGLWVTPSPGADPRPLTEGPMDLAPAWSPKGDRIVYESFDIAGIDTLRAIAPAGGEARTLARGRMPVFTPDGEWVVYSARTRAGYKLSRMRSDGTGRRPIGASPYQEFEALISPDGRYVVYIGVTRSSESGPQLLVKRLEGSSARQLSVDGTGLVPVW